MKITDRCNNLGGRISSIDSLKGLMMIFVIIGHCTTFFPHQNTIIYSFHMPVFFVMAGLFAKPFSWQQTSKKLKRELLPYYVSVFVLILLIPIYSCVFDEVSNIKEHILRGFLVIYKYDIGPIWFLFSYFFAMTIYSLILRIFRNRILILLICIFLFLIGEYSTGVTNQIFAINASLCAILYICIGNLIWQYRENLKILFTAKIYIFLLFILWLPSGWTGLHIHVADFRFSILTVLSSLCGVLLWLKYAKIIDCRFFRYIGTHTVLILCIHSICFYLLMHIHNWISNGNNFKIAFIEYLYYASTIFLVFAIKKVIKLLKVKIN